MINDTVVLDGELSLILEGTADCQLILPESAEFGVVTTIHSGQLPPYTGVTTVTPLSMEQVLETSNKSVYDDILILQIPYNEVSNEAGGYTVSIG